MKIAVRKIGPMGNTYGREFDQSFFDRLWKKSLTDRLAEDDEVTWYDFMPTTTDKFDELLADYDAVIGAWIMRDMLTREVIERHPNLKYIGTISHGYSAFDWQACKEHGITVTNTIYNDCAVAQHTIALLLEICNNVGEHNQFYKRDKWVSDSPQKTKHYTRQIELEGKTLGIIGLGNIGLRTAKIAFGLGMKVIANSRTKKSGDEYRFIKQTGIDELFRQSDVIAVHCPLTEQTRHIINAESIERMKDGVIIINTARGSIIDEDALNSALLTRKVYAAGLDVLDGEPLREPSSLILNPYTVVTEHMAWISMESRIKSITVACDNFFNWRNGMPTSVVSEG